jgi:hypothetical protein
MVEVTGELDLAVGTELWAIWAYIAIEQADVARAARLVWAAAKEAGQDYDANTEMQPAMVSIAAAATSVDGFARVVQRVGVTPPRPESESPSRADFIWSILTTGFDVNRYTNRWPPALKRLFDLRSGRGGGLLHPTTVFGRASTQHPVYGDEGVSAARVLYTTETADKALSFMREIYSECRTSVRLEHRALASRLEGLNGVLLKIAVA